MLVRKAARRPVSARLGQVTYSAGRTRYRSHVELPTRLSEQLSLLASGVAAGEPDLVERLTTLVTTLTAAVSGYAGLRLSVVHTDHPVRLTALVPGVQRGAVVTSLRLPLPSASSDGGRLVAWSTVPGSFVDLAADLDYVFRRSDNAALASAASVELDVDLPLPEVVSGLDGLDELATIHRAAGLLIAQGHDPEAVHDALRSGAADEGLTTHAWADRLLSDRKASGH